MFLRKKFKILITLATLLGIGAIGLGLGLGLKGGKAKETIALIISTKDNPFFTSLEKGVQDEITKDGKYNLTVLDSNNDDSQQQTNIDRALSIGSKAVLINPVNSLTAAAQLKTLFDKNIPVIALDRGVSNTDQIKQTIATDNVAAAKEIVNHFITKFNFDPEKRNNSIFHLKGVDGAQATIDRGQGFLEALKFSSKNSYNNEKIADFNKAKAVSETTNLLSTEARDKIKLILADNDEMALGAIQAIEALNYKAITTNPLSTKTNEYYVIGFDGTDNALEAIKNDKLVATVKQQPENIGRLGVQTALKLLKDPKAKVEKMLGAEFLVVTKDNVDQV